MPPSAADAADELQLALFDELPAGSSAARHRASAARGDPGAGRRTTSGGCRTARSRCSSAARTATSPSASLGLPPRERATVRHGWAARGSRATEIGDAVHRLLEHVPLDDPPPPSREELDAHGARLVPGRVGRRARSHRRARRRRTAAPTSHGGWPGSRGARPERPFTFEHDGVVIRGRLDVLWREGEHALVVDYKSNALEGRTPAEIIEAEYTLQRLVYALVCLRAGASEVEVAYQFLEQPDDVVSTTFTVADVPTLGGRALGSDRTHPRRRLPTDAERVRLRGLPGARSRVRGAAARARRGSLAPCASRRSATSTGTSRRSRRCSPTSTRRTSTRSSSSATRSPGRGRSEVARPRRAVGARCVSRQRRREVTRAQRPVRRRSRSGAPIVLGDARLAACAAWPLTLDVSSRRARRTSGLPLDAVSPTSRSTRAITPTTSSPGCSPTSTPTSSSAVTRTCSTTGGFPAAFASSTPAASECPTRRSPGAYWALLGPGVDLRSSEYDTRPTVEADRALGAPVDDNAHGAPGRSAHLRRDDRVLRVVAWRVATSARRGGAGSDGDVSGSGRSSSDSPRSTRTPRSRFASAPISSCSSP